MPFSTWGVERRDALNPSPPAATTKAGSFRGGHPASRQDASPFRVVDAMESSPTSMSASEGNYKTQLYLNVYDLTPANDYLCWFGVGIFHSGIEAYGMEYGFGAHDYPSSGVFEVEPKTCPGYVYRCTLPLGTINMAPSEVRAFMERMASKYHGDTYHLISKNCNHFTGDVCMRLTGKKIPGWVNRLARIGSMCNCLLPEGLQESTVKQSPEYHGCSETASEYSTPASIHKPAESEEKEMVQQLLSTSGGEVEFIKEKKARRGS